MQFTSEINFEEFNPFPKEAPKIDNTFFADIDNLLKASSVSKIVRDTAHGTSPSSSPRGTLVSRSTTWSERFENNGRNAY